MPQNLLEIHELSVRYAPRTAQEVLALDAVSLSIGRGEVVGLLGESGSGKSTLAAALLRLLPIDAQCSGSAIFDARDLLSLHVGEFRKLCGNQIALISQDPAVALNPVINVGTQISEVLRAHLQLSRGERKERVRELLREVGFDNPDQIASRYPHELSGGQRQRIVIAQAISCQPALVIADESTSKLDSILQAHIIELMSDIVRRHGMALLWITHDPATLAGFADRTVVMSGGRVIESGVTKEIFRRPQHPYTQELIRLSKHLVPALPSPDRPFVYVD